MKTPCQPHTTVNNDKGFTIIEVMIVIGIFAIGILAVASMQVSAFQGNRSATLRTMAITLASERMENLISQDYGAIVSDSQAVDNFNISWTVTNDSPLANTKTITVTTNWNDRGESRNVNLSYIIANLD